MNTTVPHKLVMEVNIKDRDAWVIARRADPRSAFRGLRRQLYWDSLDFIYFGGFATWNYLVSPFLFLQPGFDFKIIDNLPGDDACWTRLQITFPDNIPTHSKTQIFYFGKNRYLRRLDYTATVVGRWARAAHFCDEYRDYGGIKVPTLRRVRPLILGKDPLPWPTLVALDIHDLQTIKIR